MNLYQELELAPGCTQEQIKQQYRVLAHLHHPDRGGDAEKFKRINLAYEVLSDPERRQEYDATGKINQDNSIRSEALGRLSNMVNQYVPDLNSEVEDLIVKMQADINQASRTLEADMERCRTNIRNAVIARDRIQLKTHNGENLLKNFVENLIERRQNDLAMFTRRMTVFNLMLEILNDYHYGSMSWNLMLGHPQP
jgi:curved DNA-binding protein CbpA